MQIAFPSPPSLAHAIMNRAPPVQYRHSESVFPEVVSAKQNPPVSYEGFIPLTRRWTFEGLSEQGSSSASKNSEEEFSKQVEPQHFKRELHKASMVDDLCREVATQISRISKKYDAREILGHVQEHFRELPSKYALTVDVEDTITHMRLIAETKRTGGYAVHAQQLKENSNYAVITITSFDRPKLYNKITHVLDQLTSQTIEADVVTSKNGIVLDRFTVVLNAELRLQRLQSIADTLRNLLSSLEDEPCDSQQNDQLIDASLTVMDTASDHAVFEGGDSSIQSVGNVPVVENISVVDSSESGSDCPLFSYSQMQPGDVEVLEQLGEGPTTVTMKARLVSTGEYIAIKKPHQQYQTRLQGAEEKSALQRELAVVVGLSHPNVCRFIGACTVPGHTYIAYEYLPGLTLTDLIRDKRNCYDVLKLASDIVEGVAYLHDNQVLHRDLKSGNVMLDAEGNAKIVDFGLSTNICSDQDMTAETGTYRWMAPEVIRHESYSTAADVYSFGVVLWELLSRQQPYGDMLPIQAAYAVASFNLRPSMPPHTPPRVQALLRIIWHPEPSKRPSFRQIKPLLQEAFA